MSPNSRRSCRTPLAQVRNPYLCPTQSLVGVFLSLASRHCSFPSLLCFCRWDTFAGRDYPGLQSSPTLFNSPSNPSLHSLAFCFLEKLQEKLTSDPFVLSFRSPTFPSSIHQLQVQQSLQESCLVPRRHFSCIRSPSRASLVYQPLY